MIVTAQKGMCHAGSYSASRLRTPDYLN